MNQKKLAIKINPLFSIYKKRFSSGFSLLEIAIVLIIISFLLSAIIGGDYIIQKQKLTKITDQITLYQNALTDFQKLYGGLPGDLWNAQEKFNNPATPAVIATYNGNGNNLIDSNSPDERLLFWQHLQLAGFIDGTYDGVNNSIGKGLPGGPFIRNDGFEVIYSPVSSTVLPSATIVLQYSAYVGTTSKRAILKVQDMQNIDMKFDDGNPNSGNIRAYDGINVATTSCVATGGTYNLLSGSKDEACYFVIALNPSMH